MKKILVTLIIIVSSYTVFSQCSVTIITSGTQWCNCSGSLTAIANGIPPFSFLWSTGDTTSTIDSLCAGNYTVIMNDGSGCTAIASATVAVTSTPIITFLTYTPATCGTCCDAQITANVSGGCSPYAYLWTPPIPPVCPGTTYTLQVVDACGCTTVDSITPDTIPVGVTEMHLQNNLAFKSTGNAITFSSPVNNIEIVDLAGNLIFKHSGSQIIKTDVAGIKAGMYIIKARTKSGQMVQGKIVILQ